MIELPDVRIAKRKEDIGLEYLLFRHLDRVSENLKDGFGVEANNADKLLTFRLQTKHLENLLIADLYEDKYYEKKEEMFKNPSESLAWSGSIPDNIEYFDKVSDWLQLLMFYARKRGYFGQRIALIGGEEY